MSATKLIHGLENKLCDVGLEELNLDYQRKSGEVGHCVRYLEMFDNRDLVIPTNKGITRSDGWKLKFT